MRIEREKEVTHLLLEELRQQWQIVGVLLQKDLRHFVPSQLRDLDTLRVEKISNEPSSFAAQACNFLSSFPSNTLPTVPFTALGMASTY
jgi:hypothetical protein